MSKNNPINFSPLFGIRYLLFILRWCLGFPLTIIGPNYNEFLFKLHLECTRFFLYLFIFSASAFYVIYIIMKRHNFNNLVEAYTYYFKSVGFTSFDSLVVNFLPYTNILASCFYFCSFRKHATRISKICVLLTDVKMTISIISRRSGISSKYNTFKAPVRLMVCGISIASVFQIAFVIAYFAASQNGTLSSPLITNVEKCLVLIAFVIYDFCWVYPPMAISADLLIYHLLKEISDIFLKWNTILKPQKRNITYIKTNNPSASFNSTRENHTRERYS